MRNSQISPALWGLIILSAICFPLLTPIFDATDDDGWIVVPAVLLMLGAVIYLLLFVSWKLTRVTADYQDRKGALEPWIGWTFLAYVPTIAIMIALGVANDGEDFSITQTLVFAFIPILSAPLLVHASGRAIDAAGPPPGLLMAYWSQYYLPLVLAYALVTVPAAMLSEAIYFTAEGNLLIDIAASLAYLPAMLLGIILTVEAFHRTPQKSPA
jgi:hypothetical protein